MKIICLIFKNIYKESFKTTIIIKNIFYFQIVGFKKILCILNKICKICFRNIKKKYNKIKIVYFFKY